MAVPGFFLGVDLDADDPILLKTSQTPDISLPMLHLIQCVTNVSEIIYRSGMLTGFTINKYQNAVSYAATWRYITVFNIMRTIF